MYVEDNSTPTTYNGSTTTLSDGSKLVTFTVPHSRYQIGTVLEKFIVRLQGTTNLYALHEHITVLVDGEESYVGKVNGNNAVFSNNELVMVDGLSSNKFALVFKDNNTHTVRCVYKGNKEIGFTSSNEIVITPQQDSSDRYLLTQEVPSKMKYLETPNWKWKLTKGGSPVSGKTIERITPTNIWTGQTNAKGEVIGAGNPSIDPLYDWEVGKYKIGGQFSQGGTLVSECWSDLEIIKNTPTLVCIKALNKGKTVQFKLTDPQGKPMPNRTIIVNIGSQTYTKKTDEIGKVYVRINRTGNFRYKATFSGDKNYNPVTVSDTETITE